MIKNIIYDLDGTLINSSKDIINSFNYAFKINNLKTKVISERGIIKKLLKKKI